eukprot:160885_1
MILDNSSRKVYGGSVRFCKFDNILIKLVLVFSGSLGGILMVENFGYLVVRLDKSLIFRLLCFLHSKIIRDISEENKFIKWHNGHFMDCKMDFMGYHVGMDNIDAISETSGIHCCWSYSYRNCYLYQALKFYIKGTKCKETRKSG